MSITEEQIEQLYSRAKSMLSGLSTWPPIEPAVAFAQAKRDHGLVESYLDSQDAMALECVLLLMTVIGEWPPVSPATFIAAGGFEGDRMSDAFSRCAKALAPPDRESMH